MLQIIEETNDLPARFDRWRANDALAGYPWVKNTHCPLTPMRRALPMLNLALISAAGAYMDGTEPFDVDSRDGEIDFREIPIEVAAEDMRYSAKGYDPADVIADRNSLIPIERLTEYQQNAVIGGFNNVWWSVSCHIPNARRVADEMGPRMAERLIRYETQAALLIPSSKLSHQTCGILARVIEQAGIPTMVVSVAPDITDTVRPPRTAYYKGDFGSVAGKPNWPEFQLRVLDESIRWIETFDQPGSRKLGVELESQVEAARGER